MKHRIVRVVLTTVCLLALVACNTAAPATSTPLPTAKPASTSTSAPVPTATATALPPATLAPLGERKKVEAGGYSLQAPNNFEITIRNTQATLSNPDSTILVSMAVAPHKSDEQTVEAVLKSFSANVGKDTPDFKAGEQYPVKVGNLDGLAIDVSGTFFKAISSGRIVVVDTGDAGFLISFGFAANGPTGQRWQTEGDPAFDAILASIQFFAPAQAATPSAACVSTDATYGYDPKNPIKVGGDAFDGPPRERAYLDNLAGPNGEKISYSRTGSTSEGDVILDAFIITGLAKEVTLYIDEYSFSEPQAPVGFTCLGVFTLTAP